jgi:L-2-hydroxyglutarate oxidase LhgO
VISSLQTGYAGNRPKLYEDEKPIGDFTILKEGNCIHLLGIESPGLTAAPAIAQYIEKMI